MTIVFDDECIMDGKPSFMDILNVNSNVPFENKKKKSITIIPKSIANLSMQDAKNRATIRADGKLVWAAKIAKDNIQQKLEFKQADCDEAKQKYDAAMSDEQALKGVLKSMNVEICKARSELKRFKSHGGTIEHVIHNMKGLVLLADGLSSIEDALRSSGISINDLEWTELVDELLKPMKMEVVSLEENIRKAEVTTKSSKKKHDKRIKELEVLKVKLKKAEDVFQEANRDSMKLQIKDNTQEVCDGGEGDLAEETKKEAEEVKKVEWCKIEHLEQDANKDENGTPAASTEPKMHSKRERRALAKAAKEKQIKEDASDIERDVYGRVLMLNGKETDDENSTWNEEKAELSESEFGEEETMCDDKGSYNSSESEREEEEHSYYPSIKKYRNKKKQKKVARKARRARARAAELKALECNVDGMTVGMKLSFAIGCLIMMWVLLWSLL